MYCIVENFSKILIYKNRKPKLRQKLKIRSEQNILRQEGARQFVPTSL